MFKSLFFSTHVVAKYYLLLLMKSLGAARML